VVLSGGEVYWKVEVTNNSNVPVDLTWSDIRYGSAVDLSAFCTDLPASLPTGGSYSCDFLDPEPAYAGEQLNTVFVDADHNGFTDSDQDPAYYYGVTIEIDKQIRAFEDGTWQDHVSVVVGTPLYYRFIVENPTPYDLQDVQVTDPTLGELLYGNAAHVFCDIGPLAAGESVTCPAEPVGPISAEFTGMGSDYYPAFENTAYVQGCAVANPDVCTSDEDTASYEGLYWAFTPGFWKNHWGNPQRPNQNDAWQYTAYAPYDGYGPGQLPASLLCDSFAAACDFHAVGLGIDSGTPLLDALYMRGGSKIWEAAEILLRAGTASLLNASFHEVNHGDITEPPLIYFPLYSTAEECMARGHDEAYCRGTPNADGYYPDAMNVSDKVNAALASMDRETIIGLADLLDSYNNGLHWIYWGPGGPLPQ
jgi:hypothetical protein